jgi:hypothetical protein
MVGAAASSSFEGEPLPVAVRVPSSGIAANVPAREARKRTYAPLRKLTGFRLTASWPYGRDPAPTVGPAGASQRMWRGEEFA